MRTPETTIGALIAAAALLGAGCGGGGATCEDAVDNVMKLNGLGGTTYGKERARSLAMCKDAHPSEAALACFKNARDRTALAACTPLTEATSYVEKSKRIEAEVRLRSLERSLKAHYLEHAAYPTGAVGPTPPTSCCEGPDHKCPPSAAPWQGNVWEQLDFAVDEPAYFQYAYDATEPGRARVRAVGDLDCDGTTIEYVLEATTSGGEPTFTLTPPAGPD